MAWAQPRTYGPLAFPWDPHPNPRSEYPGYGVLYAATDLRTAVVETFQATRRVNTLTAVPYATSWTPTRPVRLLDLTVDWALRNGAAHAPAAAPRPTCRMWSKAICEQWPDLDGVWMRSTMTGEPFVALYETVLDSFPHLPSFSRPLSHPRISALMSSIANSIGYGYM